MSEIRYTLVSDGSSDRALMPILNWLLRELVPDITLVPSWSDPRRVPIPAGDLGGRVRFAAQSSPCDLMFVHRDAEGQTLELRRQQIRDAVTVANIVTPSICIVPVRMQEAWLLFDERAIREAAGNPRGAEDLGLPDPRRLEDIADPKAVLYEALRVASGLSSRRRTTLRIPPMVHRLAELIVDFTPLQHLAAFNALREEIQLVLPRLAGNQP